MLSRALESIVHDHNLIFTDVSFQSQEQAIVGIAGIVDAILVRQKCSEDSTHLQKMMPIGAAACNAAHFDPHDQANMVHGNLGEEALKSCSPLSRLATASLVLVDDQNPVLRPSQGYDIVRQTVLPFSRFFVIDSLLGVRLANVDDCQPSQVLIIDEGRAKPTAGRRSRRN